MRRFDWFLALMMALAAFFLFRGLGGRALWEDEAETALLGRAVLRTGLPIAFDGVNVVSTEVERGYDERFVWRWSPWLQFYAAAGSLKVFGDGAAGARAAFALIGWLCVPALYFLALDLFASRSVARLSVFYLTFSPTFLLHARQARWYSLAFLLLLGAVTCLNKLGRRRLWLWALAAVLALMFYCNYLIALALFGALAVACPKEARAGYALAAAAALAASAPGIVFFRVFDKTGAFDLARIFGALWFYLGAFLTFIAPAATLALLPAAARAWEEPARPALRLIVVLCGAYAALLSLAPLRMFRYVGVLVPLGCVLSASVTAFIMGKNRRLGFAFAALLAGTSLFQRAPLGWLGAAGARTADFFPSLGPVSFPMAGFVYELTHPFPGADRAIAVYLRAQANPGDTVLATDEDLPLQFETKLKVMGGFQGRSLSTQPDWIIVHPWTLSLEPGRDYDVKRFIAARVDLSRYEAIGLPARDYALENDADPRHHLFKDPETGPPLRIWRRRG